MKTTTAENIRKELKALAYPKYLKFHSYLLLEPTIFLVCVYLNCGQWQKK